MENSIVAKPYKWFSNKGLRLSLGRPSTLSNRYLLGSNRYSLSSPTSPSSPKSSHSSKEDQLREVFRYFDSDGDERISALELRSYFGSIGEYISHEAAQEVINDLDSDGDNLLNFQDFLKLMKDGHDHHQGNEHGHDDDLRKAFEMYELEKGSGCITPKGLQRMLHRLGDTKSHDECVAMINAFDIDGNGVLDFHEFYLMMA